MFWLYIPTVCIRVSSSFSFFAHGLMSSLYIRLLIFSCDLLSLYPAVHFLSMWLSGNVATMNSKGESASPWKIPLWIFVSAKLSPPAVNSTFQVFMVFSMKFKTSCDILVGCLSFTVHQPLWVIQYQIRFTYMNYILFVTIFFYINSLFLHKLTFLLNLCFDPFDPQVGVIFCPLLL